MDANFSAHQPNEPFNDSLGTVAPDLTPPVQPGERPAVLHTIHLERDGTPPVTATASRSAWVTFALQRWRWLCLGGVGFIALLATAALVNTRADNLEGTKAPTTPNQDALLALSTAEFDALSTQVELQIDVTYERLMEVEATRFLQEAEKQTLEAGKPCYRLGTDCVLDQFEADAIVRYAEGSDTLNRQIQLDALVRIAIVDRARTGLRLASSPDDALTTLAIQKRLEARQLARKATAEGMAQDVQRYDQRHDQRNNQRNKLGE